jgi:tetratricopeptide (TPR) repeat protein
LQLAGLPGEDSEKRFAAAAGFFETVLSRNPKNAIGLTGRGEARIRQASDLARRGENPAALLESAFRDLDEAVKSETAAKIIRAEAFVRRGQWKEAASQDGDSDFVSAIADAKSALESNPLATDAWIWQGRARTLSAASRPVPMIHYQEAINDFNKVLFFAPDHLRALQFRADAHRRRAVLKASRKLDAGADFQAALTDYEHALRLEPALEKEFRDALAACKAGTR